MDDWLAHQRKIQTELAPIVPITMKPPSGEAIFKRFVLSSGVEYFPDFARAGEVVVSRQDDQHELQREGWLPKNGVGTGRSARRHVAAIAAQPDDRHHDEA